MEPLKKTLNYNSAVELRSFLEQENLGMLKKYGQNFLINPAVRRSLADALGAEAGDEVWEIGPGLGAMTSLLLEKELTVKAFEIDAGFSRVLKQLFAGQKNFNLVEGDVMKTWHLRQENNSLTEASFLLGNLPYNIAAALLADLIEKGRLFKRMVVTVQKEVALRMAAAAGSADYSSFSVLCASVYKVKPLMVIRPASFYPKPNVDSMGVMLEFKNSAADDTGNSPPQFASDAAIAVRNIPAVFYPMVRSLFASRRKTIKNNLTGFAASRFGKSLGCGGTSAEKICEKILTENGLTGRERAEELSPDVFMSLAKSAERCDHIV